MDSMKPVRYGKSVSMPLLPSYTEGESEQDYAMEKSWEQVLQDTQRSPGYQLLFSESGFIPHARFKAGDSPTSLQSVPKRGESSPSSPRSNDTVKPEDVSDCGGIVVTPTRLEPQEGGSPQAGGNRKMARDSVPQLSPYAPTFQPMVHPGSINNPERTGTPQQDLIKYRATEKAPRGDAEAHFTPQGCLDSSTSNIVGCSDMGSPIKNENIGGMMGRSSLGPARNAPQSDTQETIHHRRASSKFSFVPVLPSPLGPGHYRDDLGSDTSGLVSPAPVTRPSTIGTFPPPPAALSSAPARRAAIPFSWAQSTPDCYSPFDMSPASDPFVERHPTATSAGFTPLGRKAPMPTTPPCTHSREDSPDLRHPVTGLSTHSPGSIPLPSFTNALSVAQPSPSFRARLDAQRESRREWIETQGRYLAATARVAANAKTKYDLTHSAADREAWLRAQELYQEAWSLDRLTEQRRDLTMPEGMRALRVEGASLAGDARGGKEGGVLGFKMALMERICAEAVAKEDKCAIEAEYLCESSKKAVRKAVMSDVARGVERMLGRKVREDGVAGDGDPEDGVQSVEHQP
jgi:hypothetical protein